MQRPSFSTAARAALCGLALLVGAALPAAHAQTVSFTAAASPATGTSPAFVAVGDFNGDGKPDLATANAGNNTVSILLGNGDGTFTLKSSPTTGNFPRSVAVGDFNGDSKPDLAVANTSSNTVSILLGAGDGTFSAAPSPATGASPYFVAVGDFNGDGKQDLATANSGSNTVSVFLGAGDGTFSLKASPATGNGPRSVAVGDFNSDGKQDLAVANYLNNTVSVLLGVGDGTFKPKVDTTTGTNPRSVAVGDFNGDGKPDLAVANYGSSTVSVFLGNGDGTFTAAASPGTGFRPTSVAIGDFNGDGKPDLAVANYASNTVSVFLGAGDGTFTLAASPATGPQPQSVAVGDFNGDGKQDLAVANYGSNTVSILLNTTPFPALISQFRLGGPSGVRDEFIELANTTSGSVIVNGWSVVASGVTIPLSGTIPAGGHLLATNSGGYSLGTVAAGDVPYSGDIPTTSTLVLKNAAGTTVDTVAAPNAAPPSASDQYAYVRRLESGTASNTGTFATDFNLVDTAVTQSTVDQSGVGPLTAARLGSPNPHSTASTVQRNGVISNTPMNIPGVYGVARYASKNSTVDSQGRLSIRRTITNNSGASVSKLRFRIVGITAGTSTASGVADLRAISSGGVRYYTDASHTTIAQAAIGMPIDAPTTPTEAPLTAASTGNGGGLNAGWTAPLPGGTLANGASVNVEFLFGIQAEGNFRVVLDAELLP